MYIEKYKEKIKKESYKEFFINTKQNFNNPIILYFESIL